jgi:hypothetical protein
MKFTKLIVRVAIRAAVLGLALAALSPPAHAWLKSKKIPKDATPSNGPIDGKISCYSPCKDGESNCDVKMEGKNEVKFQDKCPGLKPVDNSYEGGGDYVIAAGASFAKRVGYGARIKIPGIPGTGVVCDECSGCEARGRMFDVSSNKKESRTSCPGNLLGRKEITVESSPLKEGGK